MDNIVFVPGQFLSTLSLRRATNSANTNLPSHRNFYPRSPCGERRNVRPGTRQRDVISIHALLAESDVSSTGTIGKSNISIHALLAESDVFLLRKITITVDISIHALLAESDDVIAVMTDAQSISIHALLAESDNADYNYRSGHPDFYPRSPCGERPSMSITSNFKHPFLSTLSLRRATESRQLSERPTTYFYPRSPCGERRLPTALRTPHQRFLSTLSLRRATCFSPC